MMGNPRLRIEIIFKVTGIGNGIEVNVTGIRIGIGIIEFAKRRNWNWDWNHMMLELEPESESKLLGNTGMGIRIEITCYWNRNQSRNHGVWETLESESELESALVESELESESVVPESFTTLTKTKFNLW